VSAGIRLGYKADGEVRTYRGNAHLLTIAPTRAGKGTDLLIPALLTCEHSCLVVDPKGQLTAVTARQRQRLGHKVLVLNPFNIWPSFIGHLPHVTFNPLAVLDPASDSFATDCDGIAEAIVLREGVGSEGKYWTDSARQLVSGACMYLVSGPFPAQRKNLTELYDIITGPYLYEFARDAVNAGDPLITGRMSRYARGDAEERKSIGEVVLSTVTEVGFMGNKAIRNSLKSAPPGSRELRFRDLRRSPMTIYLILPTEYLESCSKWFRLCIEAALFDLLHDLEHGGPGHPVLMMMDEFAQLGRLEIIENALAGAAGYGVQLWPVLQDLPQLKILYKEKSETFIGNAGISTWYPPRENTTAEYVSKLCGETEVGYNKKSFGEQPLAGGSTLGVNTHWERIKRPLLLPEEVRGFGANGLRPDEMLVFASGMTKVIRGKRLSYLKDPAFRGLYDPDPYHPDPAQGVRR
jgi:type IV secretion system protein VirD4